MTRPPARTRRAGGARRTAVLETVASVLAARGYDQVRFTDVSAASGVAISTLQGYFGSREDMLIEALRRSTEQEVTALEELAATQHEPWRRLVALVDRALATPEPVWLMLLEFWRAATRDPELREHSLALQARYRTPFQRAIWDGCRHGAFTPTREPEVIVDVLIAALDGLLFPRVLHQPRPAEVEFRALLLDQLAASLGVAGTGGEQPEPR